MLSLLLRIFDWKTFPYFPIPRLQDCQLLAWLLTAGQPQSLEFDDLQFFFAEDPSNTESARENVFRQPQALPVSHQNPFSLAAQTDAAGRKPPAPAGGKVVCSPVTLVLRHLQEVFLLNDELVRLVKEANHPGFREQASLLTAYNQLCAPAAVFLSELMAQGILFDSTSAATCVSDLKKSIIPLEQRAKELAGWDVSLSKAHDVAKVLWDDMKLRKPIGGGVPVTKRHFTTSQKVLKRIAETNEFARITLEYRRLSKILNTYIEPFLNVAVDGRVFPR